MVKLIRTITMIKATKHRPHLEWLLFSRIIKHPILTNAFPSFDKVNIEPNDGYSKCSCYYCDKSETDKSTTRLPIISVMETTCATSSFSRRISLIFYLSNFLMSFVKVQFLLLTIKWSIRGYRRGPP